MGDGTGIHASGGAEAGDGCSGDGSLGQGRCGSGRGASAGAGREQGRLCWGTRLARAWVWKLGGGGGGRFFEL